MAGLPDIPTTPPSDASHGPAGADYFGPGAGFTPDNGAAGPPPGGDPTPENVCGAYPGDQDGDEMGEGFGRDLITEHLAHGGTQVP